jgi:hypothetical protein
MTIPELSLVPFLPFVRTSGTVYSIEMSGGLITIFFTKDLMKAFCLMIVPLLSS